MQKMTQSQEKANARLIAAAPELLVALQRAAGIFDLDHIRDAYSGTDSFDDIVELVESAIAKAKGEGN